VVTGYPQFGRQTTNPQFTNRYDANPKVNYSMIKGPNSFNMGGEHGYFKMAISDFHPQFGEAPGWQQATLEGWQLTAINSATSGLPICAPRSNYVKTKSALSGTLLSNQVSIPTPSQYFGNAGRNALHGPAFGQLPCSTGAISLRFSL
jgi:hypothetical protein